MKAVILAAGIGTRLHPVIGDIPKSLIKFNGRPLVEYAIDALKENGVTDFIFIVNYMKELFFEHFGDGKKFGVNIEYVVQQNPKGGTADSVGQAKNKISEGKFFVVYSDNAFDPEIVRDVMEKESDYDGVLCGKEMEEVSQYGTFRIEGDLVKEIAEKSSNPPSKIVFTGLMILPKDIFLAIDETPLSVRGEKELTTSISMLAKRGYSFGYVAEKKFWMDPRNEEDLKVVENFYKKLRR